MLEINNGEISQNRISAIEENHVQGASLTNPALQTVQNGLLSWSKHMEIPSSSTQSISQDEDAAADESSGDDVPMTTDDDALNGTDGFVSEASPPEVATNAVCYGRVRQYGDGISYLLMQPTLRFKLMSSFTVI
jgi:hypothetical protein